MAKKSSNKHFWKKFFFVIGIIASALILLTIIIIILLMIIKPAGINILKAPNALFNNETQTSSYDHPLLNTEQEILFESLGVNLETLPTKITDEQLNCATQELGTTRASEIKNGATPTISDYLKAKDCF